MKWALIATALVSIFFSCKKEKSSTSECSISMTGISGSYKLTALQYKPDANSAPLDYFSYMDDCEKDDIITLNSNGAYNYNDAGTVCTPQEDLNGTWVLNGNTLVSDGIFNGTISSYDCKTLVFYTENSIVKGDRLTFTMMKQ